MVILVFDQFLEQHDILVDIEFDLDCEFIGLFIRPEKACQLQFIRH
jgi:hypothetical protein